MQPGDLYWVKYPQLDGREQAGERPSIVLQDDTGPLRSPLVLAIPLTTTPLSGRFPSIVFIPADPANGLPQDSYAMVFQLRATDRRRFLRRIGTLTPTVLAQIYDALDQLTGHP